MLFTLSPISCADNANDIIAHCKANRHNLVLDISNAKPSFLLTAMLGIKKDKTIRIVKGRYGCFKIYTVFCTIDFVLVLIPVEYYHQNIIWLKILQIIWFFIWIPACAGMTSSKGLQNARLSSLSIITHLERSDER
jgi:hypothetical protein